MSKKHKRLDSKIIKKSEEVKLLNEGQQQTTQSNMERL